MGARGRGSAARAPRLPFIVGAVIGQAVVEPRARFAGARLDLRTVGSASGGPLRLRASDPRPRTLLYGFGMRQAKNGYRWGWVLRARGRAAAASRPRR